MSAEDLDSRTKIKDGDAELAPNESLLPDSGSKDKPDNMEAVETTFTQVQNFSDISKLLMFMPQEHYV